MIGSAGGGVGGGGCPRPLHCPIWELKATNPSSHLSIQPLFHIQACYDILTEIINPRALGPIYELKVSKHCPVALGYWHMSTT